MPRNEWYRQCKVWRPSPTGEGIETTTTYLPDSKDLHVGARVRFRNHRSEPWSEGWRVASKGRRLSGEHVEERETDYTRTRKASDI